MSFIKEDFLLETNVAQELYHNYANELPIIDYHNHLHPEQVATDYQFENITQAWLHGDHYKWRAMRAGGVDEYFITGNASDEEKFRKWADTVPITLRNPLYHWTHLELQRYFGITELLDASTSKTIYKASSEKLNEKEYSCQGLLKQMNVEIICTSDDPSDDLKNHILLNEKGYPMKMLPTFRPDKLYAVHDVKAFLVYLEKLEFVSGQAITDFNDYLKAIQHRIDFFHEVGGRLSDHGLEQFHDIGYDSDLTSTLFASLLSGKKLSEEEQQQFKMGVLVELCKMYHARGWAQQFHLGAIRNNNSRMMEALGPDTGYDSIGDFPQIRGLARFLNHLDTTDQLTRTILYNLNGGDNDAIATMLGNFNDGSVAGKMQLGSGWWFMDQKEGMENQMNSLSNMGLLSQFVGMLTDSRSFLSFPRHEYFRRILCNLIGNDTHKGLLPADTPLLGKMIGDICYYNAKNYFKF